MCELELERNLWIGEELQSLSWRGIAEVSYCNVNKSTFLVYHKADSNHAISNNELSAHSVQKSLGHAAETI